MPGGRKRMLQLMRRLRTNVTDVVNRIRARNSPSRHMDDGTVSRVDSYREIIDVMFTPRNKVSKTERSTFTVLYPQLHYKVVLHHGPMATVVLFAAGAVIARRYFDDGDKEIYVYNYSVENEKSAYVNSCADSLAFMIEQENERHGETRFIAKRIPFYDWN